MLKKVLIFLGYLSVALGDTYHPRSIPTLISPHLSNIPQERTLNLDDYHPKNPYHPQRTDSTVMPDLRSLNRDRYHPKDQYHPDSIDSTVVSSSSSIPNVQSFHRDRYHPKDPYHPKRIDSNLVSSSSSSNISDLRSLNSVRYHPKNSYYQARVDQKIIGGVETTIHDLPYQTSLRFITTHICGAAILDENTVITAAHCVYGRSNSFSLWSGTTYINDRTHPGVLSFVSRVIIHEDYNTTSQDNDIAILKLFQPLKFSDKIKPIELQGVRGCGYSAAFVSGWGRTEENKPLPKGPIPLRKAPVSLLSWSECEKKYPDKLTGSMICANAPGRDSCQGDSGGPLVANNKLIGVVSWGYGCGRPDYPGVYTSIAAVRSWIDKNRNN